MKKSKNIITAFLFSAASLCIFAVATLWGISVFQEWEGIVIGATMMLAAVFFHNLPKIFRNIPRKNTAPYLISYLLNTVACGFSASAYYITEKINADIGELFAAALITVIFLSVCVFLYRSTSQPFTAVTILLCVLDAALAAFAVYGWVTEGDAFFSFLLFSCVISFFYIFAIRTSAKEYRRCPLVRTVSLHSFGIFILVTFIVLLILSEGDGLDGFDLGNTGSGNSKNLSNHTSKKEEENNEENFKKENPEYFE
jgi:hypothetical protein